MSKDDSSCLKQKSADSFDSGFSSSLDHHEGGSGSKLTVSSHSTDSSLGLVTSPCKQRGGQQMPHGEWLGLHVAGVEGRKGGTTVCVCVCM